MNIKRYIFAVIALFVFMFVYEYVAHGVILINIYKETPELWRTQEMMIQYAPYNNGLQLLIAIWVTFIFTRFFKTGGMQNGIKFGFYLGILSAIQALGALYYLPVSILLGVYWFIAYFIEVLVGGIIIGLVYKNEPTATI